MNDICKTITMIVIIQENGIIRRESDDYLIGRLSNGIKFTDQLFSSGLAVVSPQHPLWETFYKRLEGIFKKDGETTWKCKGGMKKAHSILETMENVNIEGTLEYFERHGGHCDCEILFNVAG